MIGTLIFADIPLATVGGDDAFWGWIDQCPDSHIWNKRPANDGQWSAQIKANQFWNKQLNAGAQWSAVSKTQSAWSDQDSRAEDHKKC